MKMDQTSECQYQFGSEQLQNNTNHYLLLNSKAIEEEIRDAMVNFGSKSCSLQ